MLSYIVRRFAYMILLLVGVSILAFIIINLPPGDFVDQLLAEYYDQGEFLSDEEILSLRHQYGLDRTLFEQYILWISGVIKGDFGFSLQ